MLELGNFSCFNGQSCLTKIKYYEYKVNLFPAQLEKASKAKD